MGKFCLGKSVRTCLKIEEKCYFMKLILKTIISTGNLLFGPQDKIIMKFKQNNGRVLLRAKCTKIARKLRKIVILRNLLRRE